MAKREKKKRGVGLRGPYVQVAAFCEKILEDKDGVMSPIRMVDIISVPTPPPATKTEDGKPITVAAALSLLITFKSGGTKGTHKLLVVINTPSGKRKRHLFADMEFLGGETNASLRGPVPIPIQEEGLYWYEVRLDGKLFTCIPMRVNHLKPQTSEAKLPESKKQPGTE